MPQPAALTSNGLNAPLIIIILGHWARLVKVQRRLLHFPVHAAHPQAGPDKNG